MKTDEVIRQRIEAFITDYAKWNAKFYKPNLTQLLDWEAMRVEFDRVCARHFISAEAAAEVGTGVGDPPAHSPGREAIVSVTKVSNTEALVETQAGTKLLQFYEYTLRLIEEDWRIARVQTYFANHLEKADDPSLDLISRTPYQPIIADDFPEGLEQLFGGPTRLQTRHGIANTQLISAGTIEAASGFIVCDDPGQWHCGASMLDLRIPPGRHEVELLIDDNMRIVGAARVVFVRNEARAIYARATRVEPSVSRDRENSHVIAVDTGMVGLADARALTDLSRRERERLYWRIVDAGDKERQRGAVFVPVNDSAQALVIDSGCGDGGYAAYWRLDETGHPLSLIFDFADLAQPIWDTLTIPFELEGSGQTLRHASLDQFGVGVRLEVDNAQFLLIVSSKKPTRSRIFDSEGQTIFESEGYGCSVCGDETTYHLTSRFPRRFFGKLELQIYLGHRYEFVDG